MKRKWMKKWGVLFLSCYMFSGISGQGISRNEKEPVDFVDPLIGTLSTPQLSAGNTYPAVLLPFGMNTWSPQTGRRNDGGLYTYSANYLYGIRQTRQASYWIRDYGQFSFMPVTSRNNFTEDKRKSWFSHKTETATPYYYKTYLGDSHAEVEVTPTERAAILRFGFHQADSTYIVLDAFDKGSYVKIIPGERKIIGYSSKNSGGVPSNFKNYFVIYFDQPFLNYSVWSDTIRMDNIREETGNHVGSIVGFSLKKGQKVNARVASSFISFEQAEINLKELASGDFETVKKAARDRWNRELSRIKIKSENIEDVSTFYSCIYRMLAFPHKFYEMDKTGKPIHYSPYNGEVLPGYMYADNGFWDTFRAQFPFLVLMYPSVVTEILSSMENIYKESGWLPEWFSPGHRDCMIGSHSASIISDAYQKGIRSGYNINTLYEAILKNTEHEGPVSSVGRFGAKFYNKLGYIPYNVGINQNVSRTLEYAYNDFTIYNLAKLLNRPKKEVALFRQRSLNYSSLFDPETRLMRPKDSSGKFIPAFDPFRWGEHFTEGNSWQYSWSVFHDPEGLKKLMGGTSGFMDKMDSVFSLPPVFDISYYKRGVIHLVREMQGVNMGQYAHLNEPMHHFVYLYNYGAPWKAQYWTREIMKRLYSSKIDGYPGEEDNGQMSAWFVFSALGFYPLCPGTDQYVIGSPLFQQAILKLENGKTVTINAGNNSAENRYIRQLKFNNQPYLKNWLSHELLVKGSVINFDMTSQPAIDRNTDPSAFPYSLSTEK